MTTVISIEDVRREVKILKSLSGHKHLVKFHDACEDANNVYIVMVYVFLLFLILLYLKKVILIHVFLLFHYFDTLAISLCCTTWITSQLLFLVIGSIIYLIIPHCIFQCWWRDGMLKIANVRDSGLRIIRKVLPLIFYFICIQLQLFGSES